MFLYDAAIAAAVQNPPHTISEVLQTMAAIDGLCIDEDGLKWFNWLYLSVTQAVAARVNSGGLQDAAWLTELDVQFAGLYFSALRSCLAGAPCPGCWTALFAVRTDASIARIQFALAGMNSHINHDLCIAIDSTCKATNTAPAHGTLQYQDYTSVNATLDQLVNQAKQTLHVRLPGDPLPPVSNLENLLAAWSVSAARESAWLNAENLWNLPQPLTASLTGTIDGFATVINKTMLIPVP